MLKLFEELPIFVDIISYPSESPNVSTKCEFKLGSPACKWYILLKLLLLLLRTVE